MVYAQSLQLSRIAALVWYSQIVLWFVNVFTTKHNKRINKIKRKCFAFFLGHAHRQMKRKKMINGGVKEKKTVVISANGNSDSQLRKVAFERNDEMKNTNKFYDDMSCRLRLSSWRLFMNEIVFFLLLLLSSTLDWISVCFHGDRFFCASLFFRLHLRIYLFVISLIIYFINITNVGMVAFFHCLLLHVTRIHSFCTLIDTVSLLQRNEWNQRQQHQNWIDKLNTW